MIAIGLDEIRKCDIISEYVSENRIKKIYIFHPEKFSIDYPNSKQVEYNEIIMYRTFYSLLEEINQDSLLVFNECIRTQNRSELTYNCAHHYCNQTPHKIIFEYFPFIENTDDFMIMLDFIDKGRYRGKSFDWSFLAEQQVVYNRVPLKDHAISVDLSSKANQEYEKKKKHLFDNLGESDPDTIPRRLHIWSGKYKKNFICPECFYVARNNRFKFSNVTTYKQVSPGREYIIVDFPHRRIDFCDFLKTTGQLQIDYFCTPFKVDIYYRNSLHAWLNRMEEFYAKTSIYQK